MSVERDEPDWRDRAACHGLGEAYFSEGCTHHQLLVELCRRICAACPVLLHCDRAADELRPPVGIWAGLTAHERATAGGQRWNR